MASRQRPWTDTKNVSAHLKNSLELIRCIQAGDVTTNKALPYPCILDVVSLYTTIPVQEAITNVTDRIQNPLSKLWKKKQKNSSFSSNLCGITGVVWNP